MAAWRELWRYLLTLPDGPVPERKERSTDAPATPEEPARKRVAGSGARRPRSG